MYFGLFHTWASIRHYITISNNEKHDGSHNDLGTSRIPHTAPDSFPCHRFSGQCDLHKPTLSHTTNGGEWYVRCTR
jgi:hypothetical protein